MTRAFDPPLQQEAADHRRLSTKAIVPAVSIAAITKTPAMCQVYKQAPKTLHIRFEVPQVPPLVLASTCVQVEFHVSCSCARFGVPNHGQSPTELGLNYVSAGLPNPPNGLPTLDDHQVDGRPTAPQELTPGGHQGTPWSSSEGGSMEAP